jgi:hypothetical protein
MLASASRYSPGSSSLETKASIPEPIHLSVSFDVDDPLPVKTTHNNGGIKGPRAVYHYSGTAVLYPVRCITDTAQQYLSSSQASARIPDQLSLDEAIELSRTRLRPVACGWLGCDAGLASISLLRKVGYQTNLSDRT